MGVPSQSLSKGSALLRVHLPQGVRSTQGGDNDLLCGKSSYEGDIGPVVKTNGMGDLLQGQPYPSGDSPLECGLLLLESDRPHSFPVKTTLICILMLKTGRYFNGLLKPALLTSNTPGHLNMLIKGSGV